MSSVDSMKHLLLSSLMALALAGCASAPATTTAANDNSVICDKEVPTGSMLSKSKCRSAEQREAERRSVETVNESVRTQRSAPIGKGGA